MKTARDLYADFTCMTTEERQAFISLFRNIMFPKEEMPFEKMMQELRDSRFTKGLYCPRCGSGKVKRNGKVRGRQRYLCGDCDKSFGDATNTVLSGTHYPEKWLQYIEFMIQGLSLPKISKSLGIHVSTAFYWRHKILLCLGSREPKVLKGIVEADEMYMLESLKGKNRVQGEAKRKARKRGGVAGKRGISREQVCILVATDRHADVVSEVAGYGRVGHSEIDAVIGDTIKDATCICTDAATNFATYAKRKGIEHQVINVHKGERVKKGIFHVQHVNGYHSRLRKWMARFNGVATKYLNNYLTWHRYLEERKALGMARKRQDMLVQAFLQFRQIKTELLRAI